MIVIYLHTVLRFLKTSDQLFLISGNILNCDLSFLSYIYLHILFHFLPVKHKGSRFDYFQLSEFVPGARYHNYKTASFWGQKA